MSRLNSFVPTVSLYPLPAGNEIPSFIRVTPSLTQLLGEVKSMLPEVNLHFIVRDCPFSTKVIFPIPVVPRERDTPLKKCKKIIKTRHHLLKNMQDMSYSKLQLKQCAKDK